jgi:FkbM family methyltransferase
VQALAVEASPWVYEYLSKNLELNNIPNLRIFNLALYEKDDLEKDFFSPELKFGKGSLAPVFTDNAVKVRTISLDSLLSRNGFDNVDVVKVDVEGFERSVFSGGSATLSNQKAPIILFEFADWAERSAGYQPGDAQKLLRDFGYKLYTRRHGKFAEYEGVLTSGGEDILARK